MNKEAILNVQENNCENINEFLINQKIGQILTFGKYCDRLLDCNLIIKAKTEGICILES